MRTAAVLVLLLGCKPGGVSDAHELCAKAAAMYEKCDEVGGDTKLEKELTVDRWRGLCRAAVSGKTDQLMPDVAQMFATLDEATILGIKAQAECTAKATTCEAYAKCGE